MNNNYSAFKSYMSKIADIDHSIAVLSWDNEVYMPKDGAHHRSQQIATLSGIAHELFTNKIFGESLNILSEDKSLNGKEARNILVTKKAFEKATKLDEQFVINRSKAISEAFKFWNLARKENDWTIFAGPLEVLVNLKKEESKRYDTGNHPYDALLDAYEPDMTVEKLDILFEDVRNKLHPLLSRVKKASQVDNHFLFQEINTDLQWKYGLDILENMGYDFNKGRQDVSTHPFTTTFSSHDVRVTTRLKSDDFPMMLWSCIHEGGHALYEQGLPFEEYGLPSGQAISLGIHESQSRLWENNVGRSKEYWTFHYPNLQKQFPEQFKNHSLDDFYKAINQISPNLIRTESDELHYHFHVMIRYEIEKGLMENTISVNNLENIWNNKYEEFLGLRPKDSRTGILQDIHWSHGSFGYFPTYSIGSFYAAQFYEQAQNDMPNLLSELRDGQCISLLSWLRENIHQYGHSLEASELCKKITGNELSLEAFIDYTETKFGYVYSI